MLVVAFTFAGCGHERDEFKPNYPQTGIPSAPEKAIDDYNGDDKSGNFVPPEANNLEPNEKMPRIVAIDAGHQTHGISNLEPIGPRATVQKPKVSSGTIGVISRVPEYQLNLAVAQRLQQVLLAEGFQTYMIRETNDVNISNRERAERARNADADIFIRIHANGSTNPSDNGILVITPTPESPFVADLYPASRELANAILEEMLISTGANSKGIWQTDTMSGINWSTMPVVIVEMGFMSNPAEDSLLQTEEYQEQLAIGIGNGIKRFFRNQF